MYEEGWDSLDDDYQWGLRRKRMERNDLMTVHARNVRRQIERNDRGVVASVQVSPQIPSGSVSAAVLVLVVWTFL